MTEITHSDILATVRNMKRENAVEFLNACTDEMIYSLAAYIGAAPGSEEIYEKLTGEVLVFTLTLELHTRQNAKGKPTFSLEIERNTNDGFLDLKRVDNPTEPEEEEFETIQDARDKGLEFMLSHIQSLRDIIRNQIVNGPTDEEVSA